MTDSDEQLDLVDQNDRVIGTIGRSQISTLTDGGGRYIRTACALIRNSEGKYWVPRRTAHKSIAPSGLDCAMSEHMGIGETYLDAAIRGFQEELNLTITPKDIRLLGVLSPLPRLPYFGACYIYQTDKEPDYNQDDYVSAEWLTADEIIAQVEAGTPAKSTLVPFVKLALLVA
jgi:isopentenyldiphosphate isomerase